MKKLIENYLQELYLKESIQFKKLPKDLLNTMRKHKEFQYMHSVDEIDKLHNDEMKFFHDKLKESKEELNLIKIKKLYCILNYGNGDTAWYSFKDKKVYDWGHEGNSFYPLSDKKSKNRLWKPVLYKQWMKDVISGKHQSSWR